MQIIGKLALAVLKCVVVLFVVVFLFLIQARAFGALEMEAVMLKRIILFAVALSLLIPAASFAMIDASTGQSTLPQQPATAQPATVQRAAPAGALVKVTDVKGSYKKGTVYGPKLNAKELKQLKAAVIEAVNSCIREGMTDGDKIVALVNYLCDNVSYAPDWSKNRANTAWGALVYGEAQCSGYARAMVALCDAVGIGCKYVHASKAAMNPSHQWVVVQYKDEWYHLDPQMIDDYMLINTSTGQITYPRPIVLYSKYWPYETKGIPKTGSSDITLQ